MSVRNQQKEPNKEQVRLLIELQMETLKFSQHFILPLSSGVIAIFFTREQLGDKLAFVFITAGIIFLFLLLLHRKMKVREIRQLIDRFKNFPHE